MNIEEIKDQRKILEADINNLIVVFNNETSTKVRRIDIKELEFIRDDGEKFIVFNGVEVLSDY